MRKTSVLVITVIFLMGGMLAVSTAHGATQELAWGWDSAKGNSFTATPEKVPVTLNTILDARLAEKAASLDFEVLLPDGTKQTVDGVGAGNSWARGYRAMKKGEYRVNIRYKTLNGKNKTIKNGIKFEAGDFSHVSIRNGTLHLKGKPYIPVGWNTETLRPKKRAEKELSRLKADGINSMHYIGRPSADEIEILHKLDMTYSISQQGKGWGARPKHPEQHAILFADNTVRVKGDKTEFSVPYKIASWTILNTVSTQCFYKADGQRGIVDISDRIKSWSSDKKAAKLIVDTKGLKGLLIGTAKVRSMMFGLFFPPLHMTAHRDQHEKSTKEGNDYSVVSKDESLIAMKSAVWEANFHTSNPQPSDDPAWVGEWHRWLESKYRKIDKLNKAWNSKFTSFDDVPVVYVWWDAQPTAWRSWPGYVQQARVLQPLVKGLNEQQAIQDGCLEFRDYMMNRICLEYNTMNKRLFPAIPILLPLLPSVWGEKHLFTGHDHVSMGKTGFDGIDNHLYAEQPQARKYVAQINKKMRKYSNGEMWITNLESGKSGVKNTFVDGVWHEGDIFDETMKCFDYGFRGFSYHVWYVVNQPNFSWTPTKEQKKFLNKELTEARKLMYKRLAEAPAKKAFDVDWDIPEPWDISRPGQKKKIPIVMENTGTKTWDSNKLVLSLCWRPVRGLSSAPLLAEESWKLSELTKTAEVKPGESLKLNMDVRMLSRPGEYYMEWDLLEPAAVAGSSESVLRFVRLVTDEIKLPFNIAARIRRVPSGAKTLKVQAHLGWHNEAVWTISNPKPGDRIVVEFPEETVITPRLLSPQAAEAKISEGLKSKDELRMTSVALLPDKVKGDGSIKAYKDNRLRLEWLDKDDNFMEAENIFFTSPTFLDPTSDNFRICDITLAKETPKMSKYLKAWLNSGEPWNADGGGEILWQPINFQFELPGLVLAPKK